MNTISMFNTYPNFCKKPLPAKSEEPKTEKENKKGKDIWVDGFLAGATLGTVMIAAGLHINSALQSEAIMKSMLEEYRQDDTKSIKIEDTNKDKVPDIIVEKKDGAQFIYDMKNNEIGLKIDSADNEIIEIID